jgi:hypothetical protein
MPSSQKNKSSKILSKFRKVDSICNICRQEKDLSQDHIPPKSCPPVKSRITSKLLYHLMGEKSFRPRKDQSGITFQTICSECNSLLGSKYDRALSELSIRIESFIDSNLKLPDSFEVECRPNAVMRAVLGHLLAAKTETDEVIVDEIIRPSILDSTIPIHDDIHILYWVFPYEEIVVLRDFAMPAVRGKFKESGFFSLIKFYPLAFLVTHQLPDYEYLNSLYRFNRLSIDAEESIQVNLRPFMRSNFPEDCSDDNFLLFGGAAKDSVYSVPSQRTKKKKSR